MAFDSLSSRLQMALRRVTGRGSLNEKDIDEMLREVRLSLLEEYVDNVKEDRTPLDLLFQTMLDLGIDLSKYNLMSMLTKENGMPRVIGKPPRYRYNMSRDRE